MTCIETVSDCSTNNNRSHFISLRKTESSILKNDEMKAISYKPLNDIKWIPLTRIHESCEPNKEIMVILQSRLLTWVCRKKQTNCVKTGNLLLNKNTFNHLICIGAKIGIDRLKSVLINVLPEYAMLLTDDENEFVDKFDSSTQRVVCLFINNIKKPKTLSMISEMVSTKNRFRWGELLMIFKDNNDDNLLNIDLMQFDVRDITCQTLSQKKESPSEKKDGFLSMFGSRKKTTTKTDSFERFSTYSYTKYETKESHQPTKNLTSPLLHESPTRSPRSPLPPLPIDALLRDLTINPAFDDYEDNLFLPSINQNMVGVSMRDDPAKQRDRKMAVSLFEPLNINKNNNLQPTRDFMRTKGAKPDNAKPKSVKPYNGVVQIDKDKKCVIKMNSSVV